MVPEVFLSNWSGVITLAVIFLCLVVLYRTSLGSDAVLMSGAAVLMLIGIISPKELLTGFSNLGLATVAALYIVAGALTRTGALYGLTDLMLGRIKSVRVAQFRLMAPVALMSTVLSNTPVVAMMIPLVSDWSKRSGIHASKLMMPLSYAAIVGGLCTVIGTSTNLVVNDMMANETEGLALFELAWIGVPAVILTIVYVLIAGPKWLPARGERLDTFGDGAQYTLEMIVDPEGPIVGRSIEDAGLRRLSGVYLVEIRRGTRVRAAVSPREILAASDRLIFAGDVSSVVDLQKMRGLSLAEDHVFKIDGDRSQRKFVEAVLGNNFPYLGQSVRRSQFRKKYGAAIIAISRDGEQVKQRIGDILLKRGDILLLETPSDFIQSRRYARDFLVMAEIERSQPVLHERRYVALFILFAQLALVVGGILTMFEAACAAVMLLMLTRCISLDESRQSIDWQILIVIGASIALGTAVENTGMAATMAKDIVLLVKGSPVLSLAALYVITAVLTAVVSNIAAAVVLFPVAQQIANQLGVDLTPFAVILMVGASASFATPIGYQTNLMVYGPGNYRYKDFLIMGGPLSVLLGLLSLVIIPLVWPF
mgnify:FL=1|jgi:di/tricarboxylate transporter|tara:strand:+ start:36704 stop:38488 length:1785 start_codon:yes stop_codon:yes gene_type:complete